MSKIIYKTYQSPVGLLNLGVFEDQICLCDWTYRKMRSKIDERIASHYKASFENGTHKLLEETTHQLDEYFARKITDFNLPLIFCGTEFQQRVWNGLLKISYGTTLSYKELSLILEADDHERKLELKSNDILDQNNFQDDTLTSNLVHNGNADLQDVDGDDLSIEKKMDLGSTLSRKRFSKPTTNNNSIFSIKKNPPNIRAVASANGANPLSILVPCHRVIGSDGSLTGYAGGLPAKAALLKLEGVDLSAGQQSLF